MIHNITHVAMYLDTLPILQNQAVQAEGFHWHPFFNACLNATSAVLIFMAYAAIKQQKREQHKKLMLTAMGVSAVFLVSYLIRFALAGKPTPFPGDGAWKVIYLVILFSHMILAAAVPVLTIQSIRLALKGDLVTHKKWVKYAYPIWLYVSVTGVVVYLMLYHFPA